MKKIFVLYLILLNLSTLLAQPTYFSWKKPNFEWEENKGFNYISPAKDQGEQGPCGIFAAIGSMEAISQIYFHKPSSVAQFLDLSEAEMYSLCTQSAGESLGALSASETLDNGISQGIINDACLVYPTSWRYFIQPCSKCATPSQKVQIPSAIQSYFSQ